MDGIIIGLMLLCSPFEIRTEARLLIQHNCFPVSRRFVDEAWDKTMRDGPEWVKSALPVISKLVIAPYYTERECNPIILYAVLYGDAETYILVVHPTVFRDLDEAALARALKHLALVMQWKRPIGSAELGRCTL